MVSTHASRAAQYSDVARELRLPFLFIASPRPNNVWSSRETWIAVTALAAIGIHSLCRFVLAAPANVSAAPLWFALVVGGVPLVFTLVRKLARGEFGSDLLAGISIVTAVILGEYLVAAIVVLMLSGGEALEKPRDHRRD